MMRSAILCLLLSFTIVGNITSQNTKQSIINKAYSNHSRGSFNYNLSTTTEPYEELTGDISLNNGEIWDDPEYSVTLPFSFELNGTTTNHLFFATLGAGLATEAGTDLLSVVTPFETDLLDRGALDEIESLSPISYKVEGAAGSRIFKLQIKNAGSYAELFENGTMDMFVNFQLWIYETSSKLEFRYGPNDIPDPNLFYEEAAGPISGVLEIDLINEEFSNLNLISGTPEEPFLVSELLTLFGTPSEGTVFILSLDEPLNVGWDITHSSSYCNPNGVIELEVTGGFPPYAYLWNNGETTSTIDGLEGGTYAVTVSDDANNTQTLSLVVNDLYEPMEVTIGSTDETAEGANDGTATAVVFEGFPTYTYLWSTSETTQTITGLAPGVYSVTVTDNAGCTETAETIINAFECEDQLIEASVSNPTCAGICDGTVNILEIVNGTGPFLYEWSNGTAESTITECPGLFSVTVTDNNGCIVIDEFTIGETSAVNPNAFATAESVSGANDGTAVSAAFGGTPPYDFLWSNGGMTQTITGLSPGDYSVIVTDENGCQGFDTVTVDQGPCGLLSGTVVDVTCFGDCDGSIVADPGWAIYVWSNGGAEPGLTDLCAGEYSVTVDDGEGCIVSHTFVVNTPDPVFPNPGSTDETILGDDGTAWVAPSGGTSPYTYLWASGATDSLIVGLDAGIYFVTVTDDRGCTASTGVLVDTFTCLTIQENEVQDAFCYGQCNGLIFVVPQGGVGPYLYSWSTGSSENLVADLCAGTYIVTITDEGQSGCTASVSIEVSQPDSLYHLIDLLKPVSDTSSGEIQIAVQGGVPGYNALWTGPNGFTSLEEDISGLEAGTYILFLFDSQDCSITDTIIVEDLRTSVPELSFEDLDIFPNPANSIIQIKDNGTDQFTVTLFSSLGKILGTWKNERTIPVHGFSNGVYIVRYESEVGYANRKLIITD